MGWVKVGGIALTGLSALLILRAYKPEWAPLVRVAVAVIMLGSLLSVAAAVLSDLSGITASLGAPDVEAYSLLLKALGVAFLTETAASVCRDSGEGTLASWVETGGRLQLLLLSFPMIRRVLDLVASLLRLE
jgi:stage III sporulation protein AD